MRKYHKPTVTLCLELCARWQHYSVDVSPYFSCSTVGKNENAYSYSIFIFSTLSGNKNNSRHTDLVITVHFSSLAALVVYTDSSLQTFFSCVARK